MYIIYERCSYEYKWSQQNLNIGALMKLILILSTLMAFSHVQAASFLTEAQADMVLEASDNICGDTWCEGDYDYSFNAFVCDSETKSCDLTFEYISYILDDETYDIIGEERAEFTCTIENLTSYDQMIEIRNSYEQLTHELYESVGECTDEFYDLAPEVQ